MLSHCVKAFFLFYLLEIDILTFVLVENLLSFSFVTDSVVMGIIGGVVVVLLSSAVSISLVFEAEKRKYPCNHRQ